MNPTPAKWEEHKIEGILMRHATNAMLGNITTEEDAKEISQLLQQEYLRGRKEGVKLLEVARCPEPDCDNNGTIANRISDDEWEPQQCQWCHEKRLLLDSARLPDVLSNK